MHSQRLHFANVTVGRKTPHPTRRQRSSGYRLLTHSSGSSTSVQTRQDAKEVVVPAADLRDSVQLRLVKEGRGQAILIEYVTEGSMSRQLGLMVGQKLRWIEDPIRSGQMYELGDRPSLNFVLDAIRMSRHPEIKLQVEDSMQDDASVAVAPAPSPQLDPADFNVDRSRSVMAALDSITGRTDSDLTIAEQLEQQLQQLEAEGRAPAEEEGYVILPLVSAPEPTSPSTPDPSVLNSLWLAQSSNTEGVVPQTDLQLRVKRRKDYMDQVAERNDTGFFSLLFGAFLLPPAAILVFAYSSGYLDLLYNNTLTHLK